MSQALAAVREQVLLVSMNSMRIAGIQGVYGDPCGVDIIPVSLAEALQANDGETVLIDAGSVAPLFELLGRFREQRPLLRLVVMGRDGDETYIECVIAVGAKGFLGATASGDEFTTALETVRAGSIWAPRSVLSRMVASHIATRVPGEGGAGASFTPREQEIIGLLTGGRGNREIGASLGIDPTTVKAHLGRIMRKAGVANRVELTIYALDRRRVEALRNSPTGGVAHDRSVLVKRKRHIA